MYTKRIQIVNYGPVDQLDITLPLDGDNPKPVVLVGENGSGKSILLSHIVNGLTAAKDLVYPDTPEVDMGKVYKLRSGSYIKTGRQFYFARVDFENDLFVEEMRTLQPKQADSTIPGGLTTEDAKAAWSRMKAEDNDHFHSISFSSGSDRLHQIKGVFSRNCVLYFPPNRFEEPAWLNETNLRAQAVYTDRRNLKGYTSRRVISYSPLHDNQNWLFDVIYDRAVFEAQTGNIPFPVQKTDQSFLLPVLFGHAGNATNVFDIALQVVRKLMGQHPNVRFGVAGRTQRVVSLEGNKGQLVPNIFHLSSGETSILNLFLSILRDFDLSGSTFDKAENIRGIAVVDEIDLHLHAIHQYAILPDLIRMFPKVQFIVTTHSPLFVLGMKNSFGEGGFALYRLPQGQQISPEEFSEFENAYKSFATTSKFADDVRTAIQHAQKPIIFLEGDTDVKYLRRAAELLDQGSVLKKVDLKDGQGASKLGEMWKTRKRLPTEMRPQKVLLLFDCDQQGQGDSDDGKLFKRTLPLQTDHPIRTGIENLFNRRTLEKARNHKAAFIDIVHEHTEMERGDMKTVPEIWTVNPDEKANLCNWLGENGTAEDFECFRVIFDILHETLNLVLQTSLVDLPQEE